MQETVSEIIHGGDNAMALILSIVAASKWVQVAPITNDEYRISVRLGDAALFKQVPHSAFLLIQEGGSSKELYLHAHSSYAEAQQDRLDCSQDGCYRTSAVVEAPAVLCALGEKFYSTFDSLLSALAELEAVDASQL